MSLIYRENYWDSPELKTSFVKFLVQVFDLDLTLWDRMGFWDERYRPFSYVDGARVVANVCVYSMDMTIKGRRCPVAQISAVGTLPEYRRRGLANQLMGKALNWAKSNHELMFLFADEIAFHLYRQHGFRPVDEFKPWCSVRGGEARPGAVKLNMNNRSHIDLAYRLAASREPVSNSLGVHNEKLFMYWCLYSLRDLVYHIPELDILVLYKRDEQTITVYDLAGPNLPPFFEIYPYISSPTDRVAQFLFMPDRLGLTDIQHLAVQGNGTHVLGDFQIPASQFILPLTSHA